MKPILYYIHDPMCSWCWGFSHTLNELLEHLPDNIDVRRLLGGLAADTDIPMPAYMQEQIKSNWIQIEDSIPGVKFNFDFWENNIPRRSTYPACRAVIAARQQGEKYDIQMTKAIQKAYYQQARNPSNDETLIEIASELGLNIKKFTQDFASTEVAQMLNNEVTQCREMFIESYPSLVLENKKCSNVINIDYNSYEVMFEKITKLI